GGLHPPAATRGVQVVNREVVREHVAAPRADQHRRRHVLEDIVLDEVVRTRIPFDPVALRLPAGSVEVIAPDLVSAGHRQPDMVATSTRPTGRRNLAGAYAGHPTIHRV